MKRGEKKRQIMKVWGSLVLFSLFILCLDAKPGIKVKISQRGLNFGELEIQMFRMMTVLGCLLVVKVKIQRKPMIKGFDLSFVGQ